MVNWGVGCSLDKMQRYEDEIFTVALHVINSQIDISQWYLHGHPLSVDNL